MRTWYSISFACVSSSDFAALVQWLTNKRAQLMNPLVDDEGKTVWVMDIKLQLRSVSMCGPVSSRNAAWVKASRRFRLLKSSSKLNFSIFRSAQSVHVRVLQEITISSRALRGMQGISVRLLLMQALQVICFLSSRLETFTCWCFFVTRIDEALDAHNERGSPRSPSYAKELIMSHS